MAIPRVVQRCCVCLLAAQVLAGCGSEIKDTGQNEPVEPSTIELSSPFLTKGGMIPRGFTCQAKSIWLPLRWAKVPVGTAELILYGSRVRHEDVGRSGVATLRSAIVIGGLQPSIRNLKAGSLPEDAFLVGYHPEAFCIKPDPREELTLQLYALAPAQQVRGSDPAFEAIVERLDRALAVGGIFAPFLSPQKD
jgi:hypothetical protein